MDRAKWFVPLLLMGLLLAGCGPDTIFVRPGLDTPSQHVTNGHQLLERGKIDDAYREFDRARELDPNYVKAYVGLGVTLGKKGDIEAGMENLAIAERMAKSQPEQKAVEEGYARLNRLKRTKLNPQNQD